MEVPEADKAVLREITDDEAAAAFVNAKFGTDFDLEQVKARDVFSSWLFRKIKAGPMLLTMHLQTLAEVETAVAFAKRGLEKERTVPLEPEIENALMRTLVWALEVKSKMLVKAQKMAHDVTPNSEPKRPKNLPPDTLVQTNVIVQTNGVDKTQR